jgi:hypothetical protein
MNWTMLTLQILILGFQLILVCITWATYSMAHYNFYQRGKDE